MRTVLTSIATLAFAAVALPAAAQDISDPGCAAIEEWVSTLSTNRSRTAAQERGDLRDQALSDERTEPVFGLGYSRWQLPQFETAGSALTRCRTEAQQRGDTDVSYQIDQMNARIQDRLRRLQRMSVNNPAPARSAAAKVDLPDCESLRTWASTLMTEAELYEASMQGLNPNDLRERQRAVLLSDAEIEPRFGHPISEWTYNDFGYAMQQVARCGGIRGGLNAETHEQLRRAGSYLNELRRGRR